jgi:lysylphosphatidylglycerol synthetase-like protein (DUF2156 family)
MKPTVMLLARVLASLAAAACADDKRGALESQQPWATNAEGTRAAPLGWLARRGGQAHGTSTNGGVMYRVLRRRASIFRSTLSRSNA